MIRKATPEDAPGIARIWNPIIRDTAITFTSDEKTDADLEAMIAARHGAATAFLIAETAGTVLGFATYGPFRAGPGYARSVEHTVLLAPGARGRGLGRALMTALMDQARAQGLHLMIGGISGSNAAGLAFHEALGFTEAGRVREAGWKFGTYHDLVLMQKLL
ncbi:MAG: GNAT family N-acetyltransferase [Pararhodobacter sp.]